MLANLDVLKNRLQRTFIHDRTRVLVLRRIALGQLIYSITEPGYKEIVDRLFYNCARARRALLSIEAKSGCDHTLNRRIQIAIGLHNHRVFSTHLEDRALDPDLTLAWLGCARMNVEAHLLRSGEGDEASFWMLHQGIAEGASRSGTEVHYAFRHSGFLKNLEKFRCDCR